MSTSTLRSCDGLRLFVHAWRPSSSPRGVVCGLHGHGEHGGSHGVLGEPLSRAGYALLTLDLRGHGRSEGKQGHTPSYERLLDDVDALLAHATEAFPELPCFLYGHSFGGNIVLNYVLRRPDQRVTGVVVTCPWLRLTHEISAPRVVLARLVDPVWPSLSVSTSMDLPKLRLGPLAEAFDTNDPLRHDRITMRTFLSTRRAGRWALEHADRLTVPTLLLHGELDDVADPEASIGFAARSPGLCELRLLPGQYHNVQMEPRPDVYVALIRAWLDGQLRRMPSMARSQPPPR